MTVGFMLMCRVPPGLSTLYRVFHSSQARPTLCCILMVWHGLPLHPLKPKHAAFGKLQLGPKFCKARLIGVPGFSPMHRAWGLLLLTRG